MTFIVEKFVTARRLDDVAVHLPVGAANDHSHQCSCGMALDRHAALAMAEYAGSVTVRYATLAMTMIEVFVTARKAKPDVAVHYRYAQQKTTVATFHGSLTQ